MPMLNVVIPMHRLKTALIPLAVVACAVFTTQPVSSQNTSKQIPFSQDLKEEEERLRLEVERLNQEYQREKIDRERDESYREGQEHVRKTLLNRPPAARP